MIRFSSRFTLRLILICLLWHLPLQSAISQSPVKVGVYNNPPLISSSESHQVEGLFADIIQHIARKESWNVEYVEGHFDDLLERLELQQIDFLPVVAYSPERAQRYDFNKEYIFTNWGQVYSLKNSAIDNLTDLHNKKIAVLKKDIHHSVFKQLIDKFGIHAELIVTDSYHDVLKMIAEDVVDAGVVNRLFGQQFSGQYDVVNTSVIFNPIKIHIAFPQQVNNALRLKIDEYIKSIKQTEGSVYYKSIDKWLGEEVSIRSAFPAMMALLLALGIVVYLAYLLLQFQPVRRTLGLNDIIEDQVIFNVLLVTFISAIFSWAIIAYLDFRWFNSGGESFSDFILPLFDPHRMVIRVMFVATILLSGIVVSRIFSRLLVGQRLIQQSEQRFRLTTQAGKSGVWDWDLQTDDIHLDPYLKEMLGYQDHEIRNHMDDWSRHVFPDDLDKIKVVVKEVLENPHRDLYVEHRMMHKDGHVLWLLAHGSVILDSYNKPIRMVGTDTDITARKQAERSLIESENQLRTLIDTLPDLVWLKDADGAYLACNAKFESLFGVSERDLIGKTDYDFVDRELADLFRSTDQEAIALGRANVNEEEVPYADGHKELLEMTKTPMFDVDGALIGVLGVGRDITERKKAEEKILYQAHYDNLTDLPNRFLSLDRLSQLLNESQRDNKQVAVFFLDLDDFKKVNDSLGHDSGDQLLVEAAKRLKALVRSCDSVGRLGGDEFIVLVSNLDKAADATPVVENLIQQFRKPFSIHDRELLLTTSVGIAIYPQDGKTATALLRSADAAMYHAKELGRNNYSYFTQEMNRDLSRRLELEEQLHGALERSEFEVYYQPKITVSDGRIVGAEALLRWFNPQLGKVSPGEFIPITEQTGLIVPLGKFVLLQAMKQAAFWKKRIKQDFRIAVNISPRQFRDEGLLNSIQDAIKKSGLSGEMLELEITEGVLMSGHAQIDSLLAAINNLGVNFAMDDFGTGYSSLNYLRRYPFDVVKIDQSFIRDITMDPADRELIGAAIAMAHGLNLKVVAEGVETAEQFAFLKEINCDYAQGYLFGRPMTHTELSAGLKIS